LSATAPTGPDDISLAPTIPVSNVHRTPPSDIRGGLPSSDSTIRGGIARSDSTNLHVLPSHSTESSPSSSDEPDLDSEASSSAYGDDERTISTVATETTVATDADASLIYDMLHDDPEFDSLQLNSVVVSRVPDKVITIDNLEEGEWTDEEPEEDKAYQNIQELKISEIATGSILSANRYEAHLDRGLQVSTTNDKSALWGFKWFTKKNPCRVRLTCADGKSPIVPEGYGTARIPVNNAEGYAPIKCYYTPDIPNFTLSPNSFKPLLGKHYDGYTLECNNGKKTFHFLVNHKKRKSGSLHLFGTTRGGLCYTRSVAPPMPTTEGTAEMSLDAADKAAISMVEDHPKNSHRHELKLHALSAKAERLLWHQRLAHCGDEQLCRAHMFSDRAPEIHLGKDSALDSCPVCLAANMKSRNRGDGETRTATEPGQGLLLDFSFVGQHSKNATNPEQMRINDYMGIHGETCCLLLYDHATERLDGVCRQSKAPPIA